MPNNILKPTLPNIMRPGVVGAVNMTLTDECTIERGTEGFDENGENTYVWLTVDTVACRLLPERRNAAIEAVGTQETARVFYRLILPLGVDIEDGDRVVHGGLTYEVLQIIRGVTDALFIEAKLARLAE